MEFQLNATVVDTIFLISICILMILGYIKGVLVRLYDFISTVVAFLGALYISGPLSQTYSFYTSEGVLSIFDTVISRIFIFVVLFIVFKILLWVVGLFIKPTLKTIVSKIAFIRKFDRILGSIVSLIEGIFLVYSILIVIVSPIFENGKETIEETILAKHVLYIAPSITNEVLKITDDFHMINDIISQGVNYEQFRPEDISRMLSMVEAAQQMGLLSNEQVQTMITSYITQLDEVSGQIELSNTDYTLLQQVLEDLYIAQEDKNKIYERVKVSE